MFKTKILSNKISLISLIVLLLLIITSITYAWYAVSSNKITTSLVVNDIYFYYEAGADITAINMVPVATKEEGIVKSIMIKSSKDNTAQFNLYLQINNIDTGLTLDESFKYAIYKDNALITSGNFKNKTTANSPITLLGGVNVSDELDTYILYLWLDGTIDNNIEVFEKNFSFTLYGTGTNANKVRGLEVNGSTYTVLTKAASSNLLNYTISGNSIQETIPTLSDPVEVTSLGDTGSIKVTLEENLFTNGFGSEENNVNFKTFNYAVDNSSSTGTSFTVSGAVKSYFSDTYIEIDPQEKYNISAYYKINNTSALTFSGISEYDVDYNQVEAKNVRYISGTKTTLAQDLNNGDTVVYLTDMSNWNITSETPNYQRGLIFWNYQDSTGYTYPAETYSRNVWLSLYTYDNVKADSNYIILTNPWSHGTLTSGTEVSQSADGAAYNYSLVEKNIFTTDWTKKSASITGTWDYNYSYSKYKFSNGTKYIKFFLYHNYMNLVDTSAITRIAGIKFSKESSKVTKTIPLTDPLVKVGDVADVIDYQLGKVIRNIGVLSLTGEENFENPIRENNTWSVKLNTSDGNTNTNNTIKAISNKLLGIDYYTNATSDSVSLDSTGNIIISLLDTTSNLNSSSTDLEVTTAFRNICSAHYLDSSPIKIYYQLNEPIYEILNLSEIETPPGEVIITVGDGVLDASKVAITYEAE